VEKKILKIFGHIEKINSSLHGKIKMQKMLRSQIHIAFKNGTDPVQDRTGACIAVS
jgi:hypothetical protein